MDTPAQAGFRLGYRPSLDGLRGISILVLMTYNAHVSFVRGAYIGVDIFFVLSGFLITSLLVEEWERMGKIGLKQFYVRRALRLLPALFILILVCCAYAALFQPADKAAITYKGAIFTIFYSANWVQAYTLEGIGAFSHAWSLSVEEQFYVLWPLLLVGMLGRGWRRRSVLVLVSLLILAAFTWRAALQHNGAAYLRLYLGLDTRADALLVGCLLGLLVSWNLLPATRRVTRTFRVLAVVSIPFLLFVITQARAGSDYMYYGVFTLVAIAAAVLIFEALGARSSVAVRVLEFPPLVWVGRLSYGLYLWNFPIFEALKEKTLAQLHLPPVVSLPLRFAVVFAVASLSFYLLEKPFLRLKKRFDVETQTAAPVVSQRTPSVVAVQGAAQAPAGAATLPT
jgi:peptidoglycan/LPS O-acetylase OafA/YrhL